MNEQSCGHSCQLELNHKSSSEENLAVLIFSLVQLFIAFRQRHLKNEVWKCPHNFGRCCSSLLGGIHCTPQLEKRIPEQLSNRIKDTRCYLWLLQRIHVPSHCLSYKTFRYFSKRFLSCVPTILKDSFPKQIVSPVSLALHPCFQYAFMSDMYC